MVEYNLPEWTIAESVDGERQFIYHNHKPRFVGEIIDNDVGGNDVVNIEFVDEPKPDAVMLAKLMRRAADAINEYDLKLESETED